MRFTSSALACVLVMSHAAFLRTSSRIFARALTTSFVPRTRFPVSAASARFTSSLSATVDRDVEEDLDAALDDILGSDFDHGTHMEGSHPMPPALVEEVRAF